MPSASNLEIFISVTNYFVEESASDSCSDLSETDSYIKLPVDLSTEIIDSPNAHTASTATLSSAADQLTEDST